MMWFLLGVMLIASGYGTQMDEVETCDKAELNVCVEKTPRTRIGLPRNKEELDTHCAAYNIGMSCMDAWIKRCLPTDKQKILHQQIGGARAVMRFLCANDTGLRRDYLKEQYCWGRVSPYWTECVNEIGLTVREINDRAQQQLSYFNRKAELCCARDEFLMCVADVSRVCEAPAATLLKRLAYVLAQDVAACSQQPQAHCAAPPPPAATPLLITLYIYYHYPLI